jgi:hypothetical protein
MPQRLHYSAHALQRIGERGILRRWVEAATMQRPTRRGRHAMFVLGAEQLQMRFGVAVCGDLRVVTDTSHGVIVTAHWCGR